MLVSISVYIQKISIHFIHMVTTLRLGTMYICHLRMRSPRITYSGASVLEVMKNESFEILILKLNCLNLY